MSFKCRAQESRAGKQREVPEWPNLELSRARIPPEGRAIDERSRARQNPGSEEQEGSRKPREPPKPLVEEALRAGTKPPYPAIALEQMSENEMSGYIH